ncbi:MAG: hypothetical protein LH478_08005 [Chitinophagaceae bacterium]|nr:hypothetical protein [Chitinophagaceae bacterium]
MVFKLTNRSQSGPVFLYTKATSTDIKIPHGPKEKPQLWSVQAASLEAVNMLFVSADHYYIIIHYQNPPKPGKENLFTIFRASLVTK